MIIYSDKKEKHLTPAGVYMRIADFSIILSDIAKGALPTGSQIPYPLFTEAEIKDMMKEQTPPWENQNMIREYTGELSQYHHGF